MVISLFVDVVKILVRSGDGGNGCVSFHREKYVAAGGPDGGTGGRGGDIIFTVDDNLNTLVDFRYKRKYIAQSGENGKPRNASGKDGEDLIIKLPRGTLIKLASTNQLIKDMSDDEPFIVAKGGRGGFGNSKFATPTRQVPRFAKSGGKGEELELILELKLIADVGLIGFPNVGKSTLLSAVSAARPKIANYHFTTLSPNLGVVKVDVHNSFMMADIPGIIEGASDGLGLGHKFLRHIERCRLLVHLVDVSGSEGRDPINDFEIINNELKSYSPELFKREQIVVGNKADLLYDSELADKFAEYIKSKGYEYFLISAATRNNLDKLIYTISKKLQELPPVAIYESEYVKQPDIKDDRETVITVNNNVYYVEGQWLINLMNDVNFYDYESLQYFQRVLKNAKVFEMLEQKGIQDGDTVNIYDFEFDYVR